MASLLIVHHTPSPWAQAMLDAVHDVVEGAVRAVESIASGLKWRQVAPPVTIMGEPSKADLDACWELGATVAVSLAK
jgi:hypothetical protein